MSGRVLGRRWNEFGYGFVTREGFVGFWETFSGLWEVREIEDIDLGALIFR